MWEGRKGMKKRKKKKETEVGQFPTRPNNRIKTSAAAHKEPAVPAAEVFVSQARSVISLHFHADGLTIKRTHTHTQPHSIWKKNNAHTCMHKHTHTQFKTCPKVLLRNGSKRGSRVTAWEEMVQMMNEQKEKKKPKCNQTVQRWLAIWEEMHVS